MGALKACRSLSGTVSHTTSAPFSLFMLVHYAGGKPWDEIVAALNCHHCQKPLALEDAVLVQVAVANLDLLEPDKGPLIGDEVIDEAAQTVSGLEGPAVVCCKECSQKVQGYGTYPLTEVAWLRSDTAGEIKEGG